MKHLVNMLVLHFSYFIEMVLAFAAYKWVMSVLPFNTVLVLFAVAGLFAALAHALGVNSIVDFSQDEKEENGQQEG